jgi:hypothetical protein
MAQGTPTARPGRVRPCREALGRGPRAETIPLKKISRRSMAVDRMLYPEAAADGGYWRPETRADCAQVPRPCPFVGCAHNLFLDVNEETGSIKFNYPRTDPDGVPGESCALDVAEQGACTLEGVAAHMNLTRERARQIEEDVLASLYGDRAARRAREEAQA